MIIGSPRSVPGVVVVASAIAVALALASCSSSAKTSAATSSASSSAQSSAGASTSASASSSGTPADAVTKAAVTKAFDVFFSPKSSAAQSETALQHGDKFRVTLAQEAAKPQSQNTTVRVDAVNSISANVAGVTFSLISGGSPLLPNTHGFAVRDNGMWKVAAQTFCGLLQLEGSPPPACNDPSITSLPS